jgi:hypothetical protein
VTVQSLENGNAVSQPSHRHLENADTAGVYPQPRPITATRLIRKVQAPPTDNLTLEKGSISFRERP